MNCRRSADKADPGVGEGDRRRGCEFSFYQSVTQEYAMKIVQVTPKTGIDSKLKTLLKNTERQLRGPHTTFERRRRVGGSM
jgi:hypothetical protein